MATAWGNTPGTDRGEDILVSGLTAAGTYLTIMVAVDLDANTTQAIVTPDSAFSVTRSISGVTGAKFPMFAALNGDICEANFGATAFEHTMPAGYSVWDASCTWNPADKHATITLSGGDLIATGTASSVWRGVRGTVSHTTGKYCFEIKCRLNTGSGFSMVGVGNATATLADHFSVNANGACWQSNGNFGTNNGFTAITRAWDEYVNNWRTVWADTPRNGSRLYVEVLCNAVSNAGAGIIIGVANTTGRTTQLRNYIGQDAAGNSAGIQSNRSWVRLNGFTTNVVSGALTATHVYRFDIDLDLKTVAVALDGGAFSTAQSIASLFAAGPGPAINIYFGVSILDAPSTRDSITVNFGATAFTYSAPGTAVAWDNTFGSTTMSSAGEFAEVMSVGDGSIQIAAINARSVMYQNPAYMETAGISVQLLNLHQTNSDLITSGVFVNVLRSASLNPAHVSAINAMVLRQGPVTGQVMAAVVQALSVMDSDLEVAAISIQVMHEAPSIGGAGKFNRAVTIFT